MKKRIAIGSILHESNTFTPVLTDLDAFRRMQYLKGPDLVSFHEGKRTEIGGMLRGLDDAGAEAIPLVSCWAMPSGVVTRSAYETIKGEMLEGVRRAGSLDGILLALHGSMTVEGYPDPEGDLLSALRGIVGPIPIAATLDHHANVSQLMVDKADFLLGYRTHPHVDQYEVGAQTGRTLLRLIEEKPAVTKCFIKMPLITPAENRSEPVRAMAASIAEAERDSAVLAASFFVGFPWANVPRIGASTLVVTAADPGRARMYAKRLADQMWSIRRDFQFPLFTVSEALSRRRESTAGPLVLNELCDCTLGGASGDVVTTTRYLVEHAVKSSVVVGIVDPQAASRACDAGVGRRVRLSIGGKIFKEENPPLEAEVTVLFCGADIATGAGVHVGYDAKVGKTAVVETNGVQLVLIEYPGRIEGVAFLKKVGIDAARKSVIVTKEGLNPFVTYRSVSPEILMLDTPGFNRQRLRAGDYPQAPRPMYPLDSGMEWQA